MIQAIQTALSGLTAAGRKAEAAASNIANMQTTGSLTDPAQPPYTPIATQQTAVTDGQGNPQGVQSTFVPRSQPFVPGYEPGSPLADENGLVGVPNVNLAEEAVNLKLAALTYKASAQTIEVASEMQEELLNMFDDRA